MSLNAIVRRLGGDLYDRGLRANIPAPGHSPADRSVSLLLREGRVIVHTFGDGDWRSVLDHLRDEGLVDAHNAPSGLSQADRASAAVPGVTGLERRQAALRIWDAGRPLAGTLSARHCTQRGVSPPLPGPQVLRHGGHTPVSAYGESRHHRPALLAAIRDADGAFTAIEVTYLSANGRRARDLRLSRKTVGPAPPGCAVRLHAPAPRMLVGEGLFTTLSARARFGLPAWALMSTRNLRRWRPPEGVRDLLIAADRGADGEASAEQLRAGLAMAGLKVRVALPPAGFGDWNEAEGLVGPARR